MIDHKFLIFNTEEAFNRLNNQLPSQINPESIVFIKNPLKIWTHGTFWDCSGSLDQQQLESLIASSGFLKKRDALGRINDVVFNQGDDITITGGEGVKYIEGEGIEINGTTIKLKPATNDTVGGIRLGYSEYGNNRAIRVDGLNRAYVTIPAGNGGSSYKYHELLFQATEGENPPQQLPTDNNSNGWVNYAENNDGTKVVWMITRLIDGSSVGPWSGPIRISGANGDNGVDGDKMEYIYRLSNDGVKAPDLLELNDLNDDYIPANWTDHPSGITPDNKYEWMSFRVKVHTEDDRKGTWSFFSTPVLWSAWGKNGIDGDGVEYIFYTSDGSYPIVNPKNWYSKYGLYQEREYIEGWDGTNKPNQWLDDPYDLNLMPQGSKTWVSVRKSTVVNGGSEWGKYSDPSLWSYYAKDGDAGIGIVADLDNDMMAVSLKDDGTNEVFEQAAHAYIYNGAATIIPTVSIVSVKNKLGGNITYNSNDVKAVGNTVTVSLASGHWNFEDLGNILIVLRCTATINGDAVSRDAVLQLIGVKYGTGYNYSLHTSSKVIKHSKNGTISPENISVSCVRTEGKTPQSEQWTPTNIAYKSALEFDSNDTAMFKFTYAKDDDEARSLIFDTIPTNDINEKLIVNLLFNSNGSWVVVDSEVIYVVSDGTDGLTVPAVSYNIQVIKSTLQKTSTDPAKFKGVLLYKIQRVEGNNVSYIAKINTYGVTSTVSFGGIGGPEPTYSNGIWQIGPIEDLAWNEDKPQMFTQINVKEDNIVRASIVVPTIMNGKDGVLPETLSLSGKVIRMRIWEANPTPAYNDGNTAENGVYYEDVVMYGNDLYRCIVSNDGEVLPTNTTYWEKFLTMSATSFETMIANSSYIRNLTALQIVITKKIGDIDKPVAGIINGSYITSSDGLDEPVDNGIRIFAGLIPNTGSVADTAFNVDQYGNVKAGNGSVRLNNDGSGHVANGKIAWNSEGTLTAFSVDPTIGGSNFSSTDSLTNSIIITKIYCLESVSSNDVANLTISNDYEYHMCGFIIKHGFVLKPFWIKFNSTLPYTDYGTTIRLYESLNGESLYNLLRNDSQINGIFSNGDIVSIYFAENYLKLLETEYKGTLMIGTREILTRQLYTGYIHSWQNPIVQ